MIQVFKERRRNTLQIINNIYMLRYLAGKNRSSKTQTRMRERLY